VRFRRILLVVDLDADPSGVVGVARRLASSAERVVAVARRPRAPFPWLEEARGANRTARAGEEAVERIREALGGMAPDIGVQVTLAFGAEGLAAAVKACGAEVLVTGFSRDASAIAEVRRRTGVAVVWAEGVPPLARPMAPMNHLLCPVLGGVRALPALAPFLRDRCGPEQHVTLLMLGPAPDAELRALLDVAGIPARVELVPAARLAPALVAEWVREHGVDLVVVVRQPPAPVLDLAARFAVPLAVTPPIMGVSTRARAALDAPDLVDDGGSALRVRLAQTGAFGRPAPIPEEQVAFVTGGRAVAIVTSNGGEIEVPSSLVQSTALGIGRLVAGDTDPLLAVERQVTVLRPGGERIVLVEAALELPDLQRVRQALVGRRVVAVRLRLNESIRSIQKRLMAAGLGWATVVDASAVLDEGDPDDVPEEADPVRLARVAARMRRTGFFVDVIVHRGTRTPATCGFLALRPEELAREGALPEPDRPIAGTSLTARLDATTGSAILAGNRIEVELDNGRARQRLLDAIESARSRIHVQAYIVADDAVTRDIGTALAVAAARGLEVRVLVDSLYSRHESFGGRNALLDRLAARGVRVRASRPIVGVPTLEDLKQRDHRKIIVVDGSLGMVGGRNLAREYYLGFEEVRLTASSPWREVPWLDAGARIEGPAVAQLERSFLDAWLGAGGERFDVVDPPPAGNVRARLIVHQGLRDAYTLEAYLALIEAARAHLYVVNTFPLQLEVQRALVRAVRRGVVVRALFGNILPVHGAEPEPFGGIGSSLRSLATQLVHARMDALVAAGGEGYQFSVRGVEGWDPDLGEVRPHVHAKVLSVDGLACAVGSANLDITAGYWESEIVLLVEDAAVTRALEARLEALVAGSARVDRADPAWQQLAERRAWLSSHWPALIG